MTAASSPPGDPVLIPLELLRPLAGPGDDARLLRADDGIDAVTGGGLVALLDPTRGLRSLWRGSVQVAGPLRLQWGRRLLHPAPALRLGPGGWERRIPLPGNDRPGELVERGVLLDSAPALLIQWALEGNDPQPTPEASPTLGVELHPPAGRAPVGVEPGSGSGQWGMAVLLPGTRVEEVRPRFNPPHARERARQRRLGPGLTPVEDRTRAFPPELDDALLHLAGAALDVDQRGNPVAPFLLGVQDARPQFARGVQLAEVGIGGLQAGWAAVGWAALDGLLATPDPPPLPTLHLASELARWTGDLERLAHLRTALEGPVQTLEKAAAELTWEPPAAFPGPVRVLARLGEGVQRLGQDWTEELDEARRRLLAPGSGGSGTSGPARRLPVLGAPDPAPEAPVLDLRATLPPPGAFAPASASGVRHHRTLHAARLVRSWVEGLLGADPDASYGRLTLAPDFTAIPPELAVRGLRVGGCGVALDCRHGRESCSIRVFQEDGRVPLNVVFRPTVPLAPPVRVTIGGEEAAVSATPVEDGVRLSLQFPLDPERRVVIERTS